MTTPLYETTHFALQMVYGEYDIDREDQGYCTANGLSGRLISLLDTAVTPIRFVADLALSALISVADLVILVVSFIFYLPTTLASFFTALAPDSKVHSITQSIQTFNYDLLETSFLNVLHLYTSLGEFIVLTFQKAVFLSIRLIGNIAGTVLPKVGQHFRIHILFHDRFQGHLMTPTCAKKLLVSYEIPLTRLQLSLDDTWEKLCNDCREVTNCHDNRDS